MYTHGEMLPAHGYPGLRKFKHLAGNYGSAWQNQKFEFSDFPGPIVMTTNCLVRTLPLPFSVSPSSAWPRDCSIGVPECANLYFVRAG